MLHAPRKPGTLRTDSRAAMLDQAKAEFEASWEQWKVWAGVEEVNPSYLARRDAKQGMS